MIELTKGDYLTVDKGGAKEPGMMLIPIKQGAKEPRELPKTTWLVMVVQGKP